MAIAALTAWLNDPNRNYIQGKYLYEQYGSGGHKMALFNSGSSSFHLQKLIQALKELNADFNTKPRPIKIPDQVEPEPTPVRAKISYDSAPDQIILIIEQKRLNYARARKLFEMIRVMPSDDDRLEAGLEILKLMDKVNDSWSIIDEWNDSGVVREAKQKESAIEVENMSLPELYQEKSRLAPNISKDRNRLSKATKEKDKIKYAHKLEEREARYRLILERISAHAL